MSIAEFHPVNLRFAIIGDPHVGLPHTISHHPQRFHLIEVSIPALEQILQDLTDLALDFLLLPGDLTQHGERDNHQWLAQRLAQLPFPTYVVPGNHDVPNLHGDEVRIGIDEFSRYYQGFGYDRSHRLYYNHFLAPGVRLIGLNSNTFDREEKQLGYLETEQIQWLVTELDRYGDELVILMIHHNVLEHLPHQSSHPLGQRYMLSNAPALLEKLNPAQVPLIITGHLHVQDVALLKGFCEVTTGSLVSYPHPYRICQFCQTTTGERSLSFESHRVEAVPDWPNLQQRSRDWMAGHSERFMTRLLTHPPLCLSEASVKPFLASLRYLWADIADGDPQFKFPQFPQPLRNYLEGFSALDSQGNPTTIDNQATLQLFPGIQGSQLKT